MFNCQTELVKERSNDTITTKESYIRFFTTFPLNSSPKKQKDCYQQMEESNLE